MRTQTPAASLLAIPNCVATTFATMLEYGPPTNCGAMKSPVDKQNVNVNPTRIPGHGQRQGDAQEGLEIADTAVLRRLDQAAGNLLKTCIERHDHEGNVDVGHRYDHRELIVEKQSGQARRSTRPGSGTN